MLNPGGTTVAASNNYTIVSGGGADVWVDIIGRSTLRVGEPSNFAITYGNAGTNDALGVMLYLRFDPTLVSSVFASPSSSGVYGDLPLLPITDFTGGGTSYNSVSPQYTSAIDGYSVVPILIARMPAGTSSSYLLPLKANQLGDDATIEVYTWKPFDTSASDLTNSYSALDSQLPVLNGPLDNLRPYANPTAPNPALNCFETILRKLSDDLLGAVPGGDCVKNGTTALADVVVGTKTGYLGYAASAFANDLAKSILSCSGTVLATAANIGKLAKNIYDDLEDASAIYDACKDPASPPKPGKKLPVKKKIAKDPNDKGGSGGDASPNHYIDVDTPAFLQPGFRKPVHSDSSSRKGRHHGPAGCHPDQSG